MRKTFAARPELAAWLSGVLATDHMESIYEESQLQLGDICIPLGSIHHRRMICEHLVQTLFPVLPFLTWETIHTLERSDCRGDFFRYQADDLLNDLYMDGNPPVLTILTFEEPTITRHELYVEEHHTQGLSLERLWRLMTLHFFAESDLPFDYILTGNCFHLTDRTDGYEEHITRYDTNIYERAFLVWNEMEARHMRKEKARKRERGKMLAS